MTWPILIRYNFLNTEGIVNPVLLMAAESSTFKLIGEGSVKILRNKNLSKEPEFLTSLKSDLLGQRDSSAV